MAVNVLMKRNEHVSKQCIYTLSCQLFKLKITYFKLCMAVSMILYLCQGIEF